MMDYRSTRRVLLGCAGASAIGIGIVPAPVLAQVQPASQAAPAESDNALADIIVTAQKREQSVQDVPIAITALTAATLQANRVTNVSDLSGLAPGLIARPSTGGIGIASFSMRGVTSYGVVPGSDKEISIYLDGVYISSSRASIFELPDISRIEVLRGPQGTLFGRNATAGAVSIVTRDPTGVFRAKQEVTVGNYNQFRTRTTLDLPAIGPFSAYATYVHDERDGDVRNLGAGTLWNFDGPRNAEGVQRSPERLGDKNANNVFVAVKFAPSDNFSMVYKFDRSVNHFTPEANAAIAYNSAGLIPLFAGSLGPLAPLYAAYIGSILDANKATLALNPSGERPDAVNNAFTTPGVQRNTGHSLTANWRLGDTLSFKNVFAYRKSYVRANQTLDGFGGMVIPASSALSYAAFVAPISVPGFAALPAAAQAAVVANLAALPSVQAAAGVGQRYLLFSGNNQSASEQYSDELQLNYDSKLVTLTVGGIWLHSKDVTGGPLDEKNTLSFANIPVIGGIGYIPLGGEGINSPTASSIAAYAQAELHVTSQIDIVGGARVTRDTKHSNYATGSLYMRSAADPNTFIAGPGIKTIGARYAKTKPNFSIGVNYKPVQDMLFYGKYATGFVSGGIVADVSFAPETVKSGEIGFKLDLLHRRLRTNVSAYIADYQHLQSAQSGSNVGRPDLSTVIFDIGGLKARGVELEVTAAPVQGLTLSGSLSYASQHYTNVPASIVASNLGTYDVYLIPSWTSNVSAVYETQPISGDARLSFRADATWRSRLPLDPNPSSGTLTPAFAGLESEKPSWIVNGRVSLHDISIHDAGKLEIAIWARNMTDNRARTFPWSIGTFNRGSSYTPARTFGGDFIVSF